MSTPSCGEYILLHFYYPSWHFITRFYLPMWSGIILLTNVSGCDYTRMEISWACFSMIVISITVMIIKDAYMLYRYTGDNDRNVRPQEQFWVISAIYLLIFTVYLLTSIQDIMRNTELSLEQKDCQVSLEHENTTFNYVIDDCNGRYDVCKKILRIYYIFFSVGAPSGISVLLLSWIISDEQKKRRERLGLV